MYACHLSLNYLIYSCMRALPTLGALSPRGGPVQDPVLTNPVPLSEPDPDRCQAKHMQDSQGQILVLTF